MAKFIIEDHIPPVEEDKNCDRCGTPGARDFVGEYLCQQCICDDVLLDYNQN